MWNAGEHSDYGLLTIVNQEDGISALQAKNSQGKWVSADPIPGAFVCNIGDMLKASFWPASWSESHNAAGLLFEGCGASFALQLIAGCRAEDKARVHCHSSSCSSLPGQLPSLLMAD